MLSELLESRAAIYVSGAMSAPERENFELLLEFHEPLRAHVAVLQELGAALVFSRLPRVSPPDGSLKERLFNSLAGHPRITEPDCIVVTNPGGLVEWINPAFTRMCGYTLGEVHGRKPGSLLQGPDTDLSAVSRMRLAINERRPCREVLINYRKNGERYRVDINIAPILDDDGEALYFVAREKDLGTV